MLLIKFQTNKNIELTHQNKMFFNEKIIYYLIINWIEDWIEFLDLIKWLKVFLWNLAKSRTIKRLKNICNEFGLKPWRSDIYWFRYSFW